MNDRSTWNGRRSSLWSWWSNDSSDCMAVSDLRIPKDNIPLPSYLQVLKAAFNWLGKCVAHFMSMVLRPGAIPCPLGLAEVPFGRECSSSSLALSRSSTASSSEHFVLVWRRGTTSVWATRSPDKHWPALECVVDSTLGCCDFCRLMDLLETQLSSLSSYSGYYKIICPNFI